MWSADAVYVEGGGDIGVGLERDSRRGRGGKGGGGGGGGAERDASVRVYRETKESDTCTALS